MYSLRPVAAGNKRVLTVQRVVMNKVRFSRKCPKPTAARQPLTGICHRLTDSNTLENNLEVTVGLWLSYF